MPYKEHDPRAVEALAEAVSNVFQDAEPRGIVRWPKAGEPYRNGMYAVARMILARESALEADAERLVAALEDAGTRLQYLGDVVAAPRVWAALAAHRASRQPSEPTLRPSIFGMDVVQVEGQEPPLLIAPCADGSLWVATLGGEPKHIDRDHAAKIVLDAARAVVGDARPLAREREQGGGR